MECQYRVASFYKFRRLDGAELERARRELEEAASSLQIQGLIILAPEGINGTVAACEGNLLQFERLLLTMAFELEPHDFKHSVCGKAPFRRFKVRVREEIVTSGDRELDVREASGEYLTPPEWHAARSEHLALVVW